MRSSIAISAFTVSLLFLSLFSVFGESADMEWRYTCPGDYFYDSDLWYKSSIAYSEQISRNVIQLNIVVRLAIKDYTIEDIFDSYFDFESWPDYSDLYDGAETVQFESSITDDDQNWESTADRYIHRAAYYTEAPFPLNSQKIVERTIYQFLPETDEAIDQTVIFYLDPDFDGVEGLTYKSGRIDIVRDPGAGFNYVFLTMNIKPDQSVFGLELVSSREIAMKNTLAIVTGMFGIEG